MIAALARAISNSQANVCSRARATLPLLAAIALPACNGQFDFDTEIAIDSGIPPIVIEAGPEDLSSTIDTFVDAPRTGIIHIACGDEECLTSGCCGKSSGFSCVDTVEGGTCGGLLIQCDDTDDCPAGQVCCAEGEDLNHPCTTDVCTTNPRLLRVHCEPESRCKGDFVMLCNPDRPSPCTQCVSSLLQGLPPGYHQCSAATF